MWNAVLVRSTPYAVVVGGANVDLVAVARAPMVAGTSNPGRMLLKPGGVGRNVAENVARLGSPVRLVAAIGDDPLGALVLTATREAGVNMDHVLPAVATGTYTALLDDDGELFAAVADMRASDAVTPADLAPFARMLADAAVVVLDANLATDTLHAAATSATGVRVIVEPVSVPKATRLRPLLVAGVDWFAVTPNSDELTALSGLVDPRAAVAWLHTRGVQHVWVRHGRNGSVLHTHGVAPTHLAAHPAQVVDVTGAGDAMLGAFVHGLLSERSVLEAAAWGHVAARLTIESEATVRPDLTHELLVDTLNALPTSERTLP